LDDAWLPDTTSDRRLDLAEIPVVEAVTMPMPAWDASLMRLEGIA
jgi:hypothetical protein